MISKHQLYAMGEPLGGSITRTKPGGRIYGGGGGDESAASQGSQSPSSPLQAYMDSAPPISQPIPSSVRSNPAAQQFNPIESRGMKMPSLNIPPGATPGLLGAQPANNNLQRFTPEMLQQLQLLRAPTAPVKTQQQLMMEQMEKMRPGVFGNYLGQGN